MSQAKIWRWRAKHKWPARAPWKVERDRMLQLAEECWYKNLPRIDIALLCNVSRTTIAHWRKRYGWTPRRPGVRLGAGIWPGVTMVERERRLKERSEKRAAEARQAIHAFRSRLPKWRCCGLLLNVPSCPECKRRSPVCA